MKDSERLERLLSDVETSEQALKKFTSECPEMVKVYKSTPESIYDLLYFLERRIEKELICLLDQEDYNLPVFGSPLSLEERSSIRRGLSSFEFPSLVFEQDAERYNKLLLEKESLENNILDDLLKDLKNKLFRFASFDEELSQLQKQAQSSYRQQKNKLEEEYKSAKKRLRDYKLNLVQELTDSVINIVDDCDLQWYEHYLDIPAKTSGVYLLVKKSNLDYVGKSKNIKTRLNPRSHHIYDPLRHFIGLITIDSYKKDILELKLIKKLKPRFNVKGV